MHLVLHQFRKDVRQFRLWLALWFVLLLLDLVVNLGWVGQVIYRPDHGFDDSGNTWTGYLPIVIWGLVGILPALVVLADSPARHDGFLATRPLRKAELLFAKLLFTVTLVIAPWILMESLHLVLCGLPGWAVWQGSLERLLFTLPVVVAAAAYACLWPGLAQLARAVAITMAVGIALMVVVDTADNMGVLRDGMVYLRDNYVLNRNMAQILVSGHALTVMLVLLAVWHSRRHRSVAIRWGALVFAGVVSGLILSLWPWNFFAFKPENMAEARSAASASGFECSVRSLLVRKAPDSIHPDTTFFYFFLRPKPKSAPAGDLVNFVPTAEDIELAEGSRIRSDHFSTANRFWRGPKDYHTEDYLAFSAAFPADVLFYNPDNNFYRGAPSSLVFPCPPNKK